MIVQEIAAFLAFSLVWLPLTGLFIWGLFSVLKHTNLPRIFALLASCLIAVVCLHLFESKGRGTFDRDDVYELVDVGVWLVVGLILGGQRKHVVPPKTN